MNGYVKLNLNSLRYIKTTYYKFIFNTLMFEQNSFLEEQQYKKKKEWNAMKECIPLINKCRNHSI